MLAQILVLFLALFPVSGVDTRVGTAASDSPTASVFGAGSEVHGNTIPCVTEPHGHTFWTPQTRLTERKGVSPYYYEDDRFMGFRSSHWLSGGATQDYGSFSLLPSKEPVPMDHGAEVATPSYYALDGWEMTGASHSAIFRLEDCEYLRITVLSDEGEGSIAVSSREVTGSNPVHRIYQGKGLAAGFSGHFSVQTDDDFEVVELVPGESVLLRFLTPGLHLVKAASSFKSVDGARANLSAEIPDWDFDGVRTRLESVWEDRFSLIEVEGGAPEVQAHFYGSLWRASLLPRTVSDVGEDPDYDDYSLWDTFRAQHPLLTILEPSRVGDLIQALLRKYDRGGWLPIFPCWGSYTSEMIGDHAFSVIVDAWVKGIRNFDVRKAWRAMRHNAFDSPGEESDAYKDGRGRRALVSYLQYGYVPLEDKVPFAYHNEEQVSRTLEYAYDDWCLSKMALRGLHLRDWVSLRRRGQNWRKVFDPVTHYPQGRHADGSFLQEDNYLQNASFISEGTPAHYAWFVPHDMKGLIREMGGEEVFVARLDSMFSERRYWHGNEPCHQVAWLFDYAGQPWKTQKAVRDILETEYRNTPGGLSGNDDAGQMSAWYVFATLGFYPVCPGSGEYALGSPSFGKAEIHLENGRSFTILREGEGSYVQEVLLDGHRLRKPFLSHRRMMKGGTMTFRMGAFPPYEVRAKKGRVREAVDDCARHGGGRVVVPRGRWTVSDIALCSDLELHLEEGAVLLGSRDESAYSVLDTIGAGDMGRVPVILSARGARNLAITGPGTIDGQAIRESYQRSEVTAVTDSVTGREVYNAMLYGADYRTKWRKVAPWTTCINLVDCEGVTLRDIHVNESNGWNIHLENCRNVLVEGVTVTSSRENGVNSDGLDIDGCTDVVVRNCMIDTGDDALCLKTTGSSPCRDILVADCRLSSSSAAVKIGTESKADFCDITVRDCRIEGANRGLNIILRDGGNVRNVLFENIDITCRRHAVFWWGNGDPLYFTIQKRKGAASAGTVDGVSVRHVTARGQSGVRVEGFSEPFRNLVLEDFHLTIEPEEAVDKRARNGFLFDGVDGLVLDRVSLVWEGHEDEWEENYVIRNCKDIQLL
jgi:putative alpha-1,2-mannosidase